MSTPPQVELKQALPRPQSDRLRDLSALCKLPGTQPVKPRCYLLLWICLDSRIEVDKVARSSGALMDSETIRIGRDRLLRVFRYLEALNEHRNPVKRRIGEQLWTLWLKDLPGHPSIRKGSFPNAEVSALVIGDDEPPAERQDSDFILKIARPRLTNPPTPPALIEPWLEPGWENPFKGVSTLESRNEASTDGAARVRLGSD